MTNENKFKPICELETDFEIGSTFINNGQWMTAILDADQEPVADVHGSEKKEGFGDQGLSFEKAEKIIKACNAHDDFILAANEALIAMAGFDDNLAIKIAIKKLNQALSKAKGE